MYYTRTQDIIDTRDLIKESDDLKDNLIELFEPHFENLFQKDDLDAPIDFDNYSYAMYALIFSERKDLTVTKEFLNWFESEFEVIVPESDNCLRDFIIYGRDTFNEIEEIAELQDNINDREFEYGMLLINELDFEDYCKELVEDIGDLPKDLPFYIKDNIDWSGVADDLKQDYSEVEFKDKTYLYR